MDFLPLWDFQDPKLSEERFRELLGRLGPGTTDHLEIQTQLARAQGLQRRFEEAHATLDWAAKSRDIAPRVQVLLLLERGRIWNSSGEPGRARPLFEAAWAGARTAGEDGLAVDAAHMVAIACGPSEALEWNERALELAETSPDPAARKWRASLHNNIGWARHSGGDISAALEAFELTLALRREMGDAQNIHFARWSVAKAMRGLGRVDEALEIQAELRRELEGAGANDGYVDEEFGECLLLLGRREEARPYFERAHALLSEDPWLGDPDRLARLRRLGSGQE